MRALAINGARVRRGGGVVLTPGEFDSAALLSWHRGDLGVTLSGADVSEWADQTASGRDFSPLVGAPSTGSVGGLASIYFDAASAEYLVNFGPSYGTPTALHVIRVLQRNADPPPTPNKSGLDDWGSSAAHSHIPYTDGSIYDSTGGATRDDAVGNPSTSMATLCVYESISTGSKFDTRLNGTLLHTRGTLGVSVASTPWIGGGPHSAYMDGHILEVIVRNAEADPTTRALYAAYFLDRYGLTIV